MAIASMSTGTPISLTGMTFAPPSAPPSSAPPDPHGRFMTKLHSIMPADPDQARELVTSLADQMQARGSIEGGSIGARVTALAEWLRTAADSGDLSALFEGA